MDYGAIPPEVNSGLMYSGAGPAPMVAAATAWDELAAELHSAAASYGSVVDGLTVASWLGPSSTSMTAAAARYVTWVRTTATQAEQTAAQAWAAAAAYETAFAATVPPPVVAANRSLLMTLIATNILGQNTPAIATTEAHYAEMWAQDAAAMYGYAGSSAAATQLTPFTEPPQTTNTSGTAMQATAVAKSGTVSGSNTASRLSQLTTSVPHALQSLATGTTTSTGLPPVPPALTEWNNIWSTITGPYFLQGWSSIPGGPFLSFGQAYAWGQNGQGAAAWLAGPKAISGALAPLASDFAPAMSHGGLAGSVSGSMGRAPMVGSLSVPQAWTQAAPAIRTLASVLPADLAAPMASFAGEGGIFSEMALSGLAGQSVAAAARRSVSGTAASSFGSAVVEAEPATATIIVIPALEA